MSHEPVSVLKLHSRSFEALNNFNVLTKIQKKDLQTYLDKDRHVLAACHMVAHGSEIVLAAPPSDIPVAGSGHKHYSSSGVYQNLLIVL